MIKPEKKSPGLLAIALTSLLLLSSTSAASFINHNLLNPADLIVEPEIPNIPDNLRGHPHSHHHAHGHLYRLRRHRRAEVLASEMPFTFVHNTIELHQKRTPQTASDEKDTGNETEKDSKTDEKVVEEEKANQDDVVCEVGVVCPKGTYCTKTGCCPNGRECTGIETCLDYDDSRCPKNMACWYVSTTGYVTAV
ncbi:hypothetical protein BDZ91DRAFT_400740 [Kalaharituber pfeilii]|nr:hypothetical protein BDZ91DRAFT_400740 [Kalaharituber pfeilii]